MNNNSSKADILRAVILSRYKSVRQFAVQMNIPYSTLVTALERGIEGMAYSTVIRICEALMLNPVDFTPLEDGDELSAQITTKKVMGKFNLLNKAGRRKVMDILDDYTKNPLYVKEDAAREQGDDNAV
ncbi:MAG: helix-turn-helix transcriptional regulator [Lachnospiraceae bacterium]|nr:helix-turn-helix transcriptional regulator [Lachnospiraceae bacterium]